MHNQRLGDLEQRKLGKPQDAGQALHCRTRRLERAFRQSDAECRVVKPCTKVFAAYQPRNHAAQLLGEMIRRIHAEFAADLVDFLHRDDIQGQILVPAKGVIQEGLQVLAKKLDAVLVGSAVADRRVPPDTVGVQHIAA